MKTHRFRFLGLLGVVLGLSLILGACSGGDDDGGGTEQASGGEGESRTIYVNQYSREIPYFQEILSGMEEKASEFGWELDEAFANNDASQQTDQIETAIVTQPDAMTVIPIDHEALVPPVSEARAAGIPVFLMGDDFTEAHHDDRDAFIGVNYLTMGEEKAQWIVDQLGGEGTVGYIPGIRGLDFTESQGEGAMSVFDEAEGIEVVEGPYTGAFSSDEGLRATENLLARESNLDAIYFDNDDIALGGIQAVEARGINHDNILLVGTDGGPAALDAVQEGVLDMTLSLCGFMQGKIVMDQLWALLEEGQEPDQTTYTDTETFTPNNIDEKLRLVEEGEC